MRALRTAVASLARLAVLAGALVAPAQGKQEARRVVMLGLTRPESALATFVREASTPGSSTYGHYLTLGQLRGKFGSAPALRNRVIKFLRRQPGVRSPKLDSTATVVCRRPCEVPFTSWSRARPTKSARPLTVRHA